jgi:hypothetical protein
VSEVQHNGYHRISGCSFVHPFIYFSSAAVRNQGHTLSLIDSTDLANAVIGFAQAASHVLAYYVPWAFSHVRFVRP